MTRWMMNLMALGLASLGACTLSMGTPARDDAAVIRAEVEAASAAFHEALRTDDVEALMGHVADDVVMAPPGEAPIRGKEAMRGWYAGFLAQYRTTSFTLADQEVLVGDGWAVESGTFEWGLASVAGGESMVDRGAFMQVWKRTPEGAWKFAREIWNSGTPAPTP